MINPDPSHSRCGQKVSTAPPLFFKTLARQLREIFETHSGLPSPGGDQNGAAATIYRELVWLDINFPWYADVSKFHLFLFELSHLYQSDRDNQHGHGIASSEAFDHAIRHKAGEFDREHARLCLARFSPLFIDVMGDHVVVGRNWTLDALVIDPLPDLIRIRVVLRSLSTGNYRRISWHVGGESSSTMSLEPAHPFVSPEMQVLFAGWPGETEDLLDSIDSHSDGFTGLKGEVENLVWLFSAWLYRSLDQKDTRSFRRAGKDKPYKITPPRPVPVVRNALQ